MHGAYLKQTLHYCTQFLSSVTHSLPCCLAVRLIAIYQEVSFRVCCKCACSSNSLAVALHLAKLKHIYMAEVLFCEIFKCAHLKFTISGQSKLANIYTHTVTLFWGLLWLAPIIAHKSQNIQINTNASKVSLLSMGSLSVKTVAERYF